MSLHPGQLFAAGVRPCPSLWADQSGPRGRVEAAPVHAEDSAGHTWRPGSASPAVSGRLWSGRMRTGLRLPTQHLRLG